MRDMDTDRGSADGEGVRISELGIQEGAGLHERSASSKHKRLGAMRTAVRLTINACYLVFAVLSFLIDLMLFGSIVMVTRLLPIPSSLKKAIYRAVKVTGHHMIVSLFEFWFPHAIFVKYSKEVQKHRKNIVISNHCSDYDWLFISQVMLHLKKLSALYITMKASLRKIPVIGYIMEAFGHVFLARRKSAPVKSVHVAHSADMDVLGSFVATANKTGAYEILLFPEGTYPTEKSIRAARTYAKENGMMHKNEAYTPELVLIPRNGGFDFMRSRPNLDFDGVVDITILMNPYIRMPYSEFSLLNFMLYGSQDLNQAFIVSYTPRKSIDDSFLHEAFCRKDRTLRQYVDHVSTRANGKVVFTPIRDIDSFKQALEKIDPVTAGDRVEAIYMHSPYRPFVLMLAPLIVGTLVYAIPRLLFAVHSTLSEHFVVTG